MARPDRCSLPRRQIGPRPREGGGTAVQQSKIAALERSTTLRQAIEAAVALVSADGQAGLLRKFCVYMGICAAFGTGAAAGALLTERMPTLTLGVPVVVLLMVLLLCEASPASESWRK